MIVDCFPYFKEKEILELRIKLLHNYVDKFIICDGNHTQSGIPKEYTCKNTLSELGINSDKIVVIEVDMPSLQDEKDSWVRERMQRNAAAPFIEDESSRIKTTVKISVKNLKKGLAESSITFVS